MDLERTFTFRNSKQTYSGIPIIVANMDTVGTFEMAAVMAQVGQALFLQLLTLNLLRTRIRKGAKSLDSASESGWLESLAIFLVT